MKNTSAVIAIVLCLICFALFTGCAVWCAVNHESTALVAVWSLIGLVWLLPIVAFINRRTTLREDDFTYRTRLGREYEYSYKDILHYRLTEHELWMWSADKRLVIDRDAENADDMLKILRRLGIPVRDPKAEDGVFDADGEQASLVNYRDQRKSSFILLIGLAVVFAASAAGLFVYGAVNHEESLTPAGAAVLLLFILALMGGSVVEALCALNCRVEMYRDHFIYRNWRCKRISYSYRDCVCRHEKKLPNTAHRFKTTVTMKDGSRIRLDNNMLRDGFGAAIGYAKLPKK